MVEPREIRVQFGLEVREKNKKQTYFCPFQEVRKEDILYDAESQS